MPWQPFECTTCRRGGWVGPKKPDDWAIRCPQCGGRGWWSYPSLSSRLEERTREIASVFELRARAATCRRVLAKIAVLQARGAL